MKPEEQPDALMGSEIEPVRNNLFFVGIVYTGDDECLDGTVKSALRQKLAGSKVAVYIFHHQKNLPQINLAAEVTLVSFSDHKDFFKLFIDTIELSPADYYTVIWAGEEFFDSAFDSAGKILKKYDDINWLTGIQTFRAKGGFNISLGNTAIRRWSYVLYERNLYKNSGRYIPPASTFWKKSAWQSASSQLHFVSQATFCEDLWLAFFKSQKLYTCKIYFSTSCNYEKLDELRSRQPNNYSAIEDSVMRRVLEFFFINNIPYLRLFYRTVSKLTPVIRFDHSTQSYFLSEY
jgi:hypothetical protein